MKIDWKHNLAPALALTLILQQAAVLAQTTGAQQPQPQMQEQQRPGERGEQAHQQKIIRTDRLIGQTVRNRQNERVGRIDDLALNVEDKRVAYAVVNRGGMWSIGGDSVALPFDQIQPDPAARVVRLSEQQLQQARAIDTNQAWPATIGEAPVGTAGGAPQHRTRVLRPRASGTRLDLEFHPFCCARGLGTASDERGRTSDSPESRAGPPGESQVFSVTVRHPTASPRVRARSPS